MQTLDSVVFLEQYPTLDLHGYDRESARVAINDFIRDEQKLKEEIVVIVHGIGSGILYRVTCDTLKRNKQVADFKTFYHNNGCTIVQIKIDLP